MTSLLAAAADLPLDIACTKRNFGARSATMLSYDLPWDMVGSITRTLDEKLSASSFSINAERSTIPCLFFSSSTLDSTEQVMTSASQLFLEFFQPCRKKSQDQI